MSSSIPSLGGTCTPLPDFNTTPAMEPSGLTIVPIGGKPWLFMVSDNSGMAKISLSTSPVNGSWLTITPNPSIGSNGKPDKTDDYECVAATNNPAVLLIGVEGDRTQSGSTSMTSPKVRMFNAASSTSVGYFESRSWTLTPPSPFTQQNAGMEALTYIPAYFVPNNWTAAPNSVFVLMATQSVADAATAYSLSFNGEQDQTCSSVGSISIPPVNTGNSDKPLISELYFDYEDKHNPVLYVLYDASSSKHDYLQAFSWGISQDHNGLQHVKLTSLGVVKMPWVGCEGLAVLNGVLYFATDGGSDTSHDGVYMVTDFIPGFISGN